MIREAHGPGWLWGQAACRTTVVEETQRRKGSLRRGGRRAGGTSSFKDLDEGLFHIMDAFRRLMEPADLLLETKTRASMQCFAHSLGGGRFQGAPCPYPGAMHRTLVTQLRTLDQEACKVLRGLPQAKEP